MLVSWFLLVHTCYTGDTTAQKMKFSIKDFFSKYDQIRNLGIA